MKLILLTIALAALVGLGLLVIGCSADKAEILEYGNVFQYKLESDPRTGVPIRISGLCGRSMYCVGGMTPERRGQALIILVKLKSCGPGDSGTFSFPLSVPDEVRELKFGKDEHLLWRR